MPVKKIRDMRVRLGLSLDTASPEVLTLADTWYTLNSTMQVDESNNFTGLVCDIDGAKTLFAGSSQGYADKICKITYGLFANGSSTPIVETTLDMTAAGKLVNFSATRFLTLNNTDALSIKIKSDTAATTYNFNTLEVSFIGD